MKTEKWTFYEPGMTVVCDGDIIAKVTNKADGEIIAAAPEMAEMLAVFSRYEIIECYKCAGNGIEPGYTHGEACQHCGGYGEVVDSIPSPEDVKDARALLARVKGEQL